MTILGQDWLCDDRNKHYLGRQSTFANRGMTFLGQDWLCTDGGIPFFGQDWVCDVWSIQT